MFFLIKTNISDFDGIVCLPHSDVNVRSKVQSQINLVLKPRSRGVIDRVGDSSLGEVAKPQKTSEPGKVSEREQCSEG
jgi:hypothetical protein